MVRFYHVSLPVATMTKRSGEDTVPLLSRDSNRVSSHHVRPEVNDFEHADSWGLLHESDTDQQGIDLERGDILIDHRPTNMLHKTVSNRLVKQKKRYTSKKRPKSRYKSKSASVSKDGNNNVADVHTNEDEEYDSTSSTSLNTSMSSSMIEEDDYNSRPSSQHSSDSSSLDDVFIVQEDEDNGNTNKVWPDISVLEEFSKEEIERLRRQAQEDVEHFKFNFDDTEEDTDLDQKRNNAGSIYTKNDYSKNGILFSTPIVTNIDVPELGYKKVNEAEQLSKHGRLRPKRVAPWHLRQINQPSTLINGLSVAGTSNNMYKTANNNRNNHDNLNNRRKNTNLLLNTPPNSDMRDNLLVGRNIKYPHHIISNNPEHFRFAYFRMDLDATIHSPTISGLLQPGETFEDLFVSSVYMQDETINKLSSPPVIPTPSTNTALSPMNGIDTAIANNNNNNNAATNNNSTIVINGHILRKNPSLVSTGGAAMSSITPSNLTNIDTALEDIPPFWLDVVNPTEEEMKVLSKAFGIHPLTTEDIFLGEIREKVELFKDYYLICFRSFDIVAERHTRKKREKFESSDRESVYSTNQSNYGSGNNNSSNGGAHKLFKGKLDWLKGLLKLKRRRSSVYSTHSEYGDIGQHSAIDDYVNSNRKRRQSILKKQEEKEKYKRKSGDRHKPRAGELEPLNVYIIVFRTGVLTFHFAPTPHPINVRRRARLLKDYLNVTSDWIAYALIDDITDAFAPMIELIEDEVYDIEDEILKMNRSGDSSDSDSSDSDLSDSSDGSDNGSANLNRNRFFDSHSRRTTFSHNTYSTRSSHSSSTTSTSRSTRSSDSSSFNANIIGWKKKGDMLRRIGDCRKRVMSIVRLLGAKADVIKGFAKRYNGQWDSISQNEISMYLDDIQDHIITMVSSLNHFEKLLSRSHSNYLAQINIDMTKVNNDMNDVLGKITILGTIVLPMNVITGLWGMNVVVPGQFQESLIWFFSILISMMLLAYGAYMYTKQRFGF